MRRLLVIVLFVVLVAVVWLLWPSPPALDAEAIGKNAGLSQESSGKDGPRSSCQGRIEGRVIDGFRRGVSLARVWTASGRTLSDDDGRFALGDLSAGAHFVQAKKDGLLASGSLAQQQVEVTLAGDGGQTSCVRNLELVLHHPAHISGRVVAHGDGVPARLGLLVMSARGLAKMLGPHALDGAGTARADGMFDLQVAPGRLRVLAEAEGFAVAESRELSLADGERVSGLIIDLAPASVVTVQVVDGAAKPIAGAALVLNAGGLAVALRGQSSSLGTFRFEGVPIGPATLIASADGYRRQQQDVDVAGQGTTQVRLVLEKGQGLYGQVLEPQGSGAAGAMVLVRAGKTGKLIRCDSDGHFSWEQAPPGEVSGMAVSPFFDSSESLVLRAGEEAVLQLKPGGSIRGVVVDGSGQAVTSYSLAVERFEVEGPAPYRAKVYPVQSPHRSDGAFELPRLRPGRYILRARSRDLAPGRSEWITVDASALTDGVRIILRQGGAIVGSVLNDDGLAVAGARLELYDIRQPFEPREAFSDGAGAFVLAAVESGRRSLQVSADGYRTQIVSGIEVPAGGTARRDIVLALSRRGDAFSFAGIGAVLMQHREGVYIRKVMPEYGAAAQGLRHGDLIVRVDGEEIADMALDQVVDRIRGEEGVGVEIEVERPGEGLITVEVERGQVVVKKPSS